MSKFTLWTDEQAAKWAHDAAEKDFHRFHGIDEEFEGWENEDFERGFEAGLTKAAEQIEKLEKLCQIMFDPENQPPQYTIEEAFKIWKGGGV